MFASIKLVGVPPDAVSGLHDALASAECARSPQIRIANSGLKVARPASYVEILNSGFNIQHDAYVVELRVSLVEAVRRVKIDNTNTSMEADLTLCTPLRVIRTILGALEPALGKEDEVLWPADADSEKRIQIVEERRQKAALIKFYCDGLVGATLPVDLWRPHLVFLHRGTELDLNDAERIREVLSGECPRFDTSRMAEHEFTNRLREVQEMIASLG